MQINYKDNLEKLKLFLKLYGKNYPKEIQEYIKDTFPKYELNQTTDILLQIYALFGMLKDSENHYLQFAKMIGEKYGYDKDIVEVGCGYLPMFAKYYNQLQTKNNEKSKITVYDPNLVVNKANNIKLQKKNFTLKTDLNSCDLLVGILPCEATRTIVNKAVDENKEFFIAMCGCTHFELKELPWGPYGPISLPYKQWVQGVYDLASYQKFDGYEVKMEYADFPFPYPIISSKKILKK